MIYQLDTVVQKLVPIFITAYNYFLYRQGNLSLKNIHTKNIEIPSRIVTQMSNEDLRA